MLYHLFAFIECCYSWNWHTAQKMKFSIKDFSSKSDQIRSFQRIWSHLLEKSSIENFIFCTVTEVQIWRSNTNFPAWELLFFRFPRLKYISNRIFDLFQLLHCMRRVQIWSFFWSVFSCVRTGYGDLILESPYSVWIQKNTDQKKLRIWTFFTQYLLSWITLWSCLEISFLPWNDGVCHFRP